MPLTYDNSRIVGGLMPSLDLGFSDNDYRLGLKKVGFSDIVTFSRASDGGRFNASGQYEWLAADQPRFDYDPVTGECRGILIEEQRTNLFTHSEDFSATAWSKSQGTAVEEGIAAWSGKPQYRLTATEAGAFAGRITRAVGVSSASYSCGFFIKRGTANWACITVEMDAAAKGRRVWFDLVDGVVGGNVPAGNSQSQWAWRAGIQKVSESEFFCWVSVDVTESGSLSSVIIAPDSNLSSTVSVGNSIFISGAQLEAGEFPTSYIPTDRSKVTRAADLCSVDNLSPWFNAEAGAALIDYVPAGPRTNPAFALSFNAGPNNYLGVGYMTSLTSSGPSFWRNAGVGGFTPTLAEARYNLQNKVATTWDSVSRALTTTAGGKSPVSIKSITELPSVVRLELFRLSGLFLASGHIRRIRYIPRRISDTELQALTAL